MFGRFFEVPKMIQKILQYVREPKLAILGNIPPQTFKHIVNNKEKTKTRLTLVENKEIMEGRKEDQKELSTNLFVLASDFSSTPTTSLFD